MNLLKNGLQLDLGNISLSENEIIDFAKRYDPLEFHTNIEVAKKSIFKGLVASGPHIFNSFYRLKWIPRFGSSVLAGMEINQWKFIKPIFAEESIHCTVEIKDLIHKPEKGIAIVKWYYEFKNTKNEICQFVYLTILHQYP